MFIKDDIAKIGNAVLQCQVRFPPQQCCQSHAMDGQGHLSRSALWSIVNGQWDILISCLRGL